MNKVAPILVLHARAEARAILYAAGEIDSFAEAIAPLRKYAYDSGLMKQFGDENIYEIIASIFKDTLGCGEVGRA